MAYGGPSGLLQSPDLYKYVLETSVYPREPDLLKELRDATIHKPHLGTTPDTAQFLALILKLINAKKTIEIGVFTGYSLLVTALSIPQDGKIVAIDVDSQPYESIGLPIFKKANVENKIEFIESEALPALDLLLQKQENEDSLDFAFVDADKTNQKEYHERLMKLVKVGGVIVYDNTLWGGTVAHQQIPAAKEGRKHSWKDVIEFNRMVAADSRVDISQVALGDGITICRRIF